nr:hypothetical protein [uncultured Rhodoferax sp.]
MTLYQSTLAHLVWMAQMEGAKAHACYWALELQSDESGLWPDIAAKLMERVPGLAETMANERRRLDGQAKHAESVRQSPMKRP